MKINYPYGQNAKKTKQKTSNASKTYYHSIDIRYLYLLLRYQPLQIPTNFLYNNLTIERWNSKSKIKALNVPILCFRCIEIGKEKFGILAVEIQGNLPRGGNPQNQSTKTYPALSV